MKIIFNDATELQVQKVYTDASGALRIKTISATQEQLKELFSDQTKTKKVTVQERGQTLAVYENYTQFDGIMSYTAGILEPVLYKADESPAEKIQRLEMENEALLKKVGMLEGENVALLEKVDMLTGCMLEVSELVYQ